MEPPNFRIGSKGHLGKGRVEQSSPERLIYSPFEVIGRKYLYNKASKSQPIT
jgi:hypothetical protein